MQIKHDNDIFLEIVFFGIHTDELQDYTDHLQIPDGPISRSRAKKIKEAMQGLVQSTWMDMETLSCKDSTSKLNFQEERNMINLIQAVEGNNIVVLE